VQLYWLAQAGSDLARNDWKHAGECLDYALADADLPH
jgi:hypothetical protein